MNSESDQDYVNTEHIIVHGEQQSDNDRSCPALPPLRIVNVTAVEGEQPELESAPGLSEIKQVELYTKWRKLIPDQFQDDVCPKPTDEVLNKVKKDKADKAKTKKLNSQKGTTSS